MRKDTWSNQLAGDPASFRSIDIPLDEGDEQAVPNLNEAVAEEAAVADQEDDQLGGDLHGGAIHVLPFDINLYASPMLCAKSSELQHDIWNHGPI
jgi:hypothetical protein